MDMVFVSIHFNDVDFWMSSFQAFDQVGKVATHTALQDFSSELGGEDDMVFAMVDGVSLSPVGERGHTATLSRRQRAHPSTGCRP